jgi:hypothetical protein
MTTLVILNSSKKSKRRKTFFFEKRSKKLLFTEGCGTVRASAPKDQKFFVSFFQKRNPSFFNERG